MSLPAHLARDLSPATRARGQNKADRENKRVANDLEVAEILEFELKSSIATLQTPLKGARDPAQETVAQGERGYN
jgi:hypothetical protein